ncbi:MAG TPA: 2-phospho-L-lactate guanylyltransferase [Candidatus Sulfotelmatobacter sp.]|nr:2-phospho-L-lactate guanylyltransferase [Candidatus Sulfotelmatobacter sp.]
MNRVWAVVPAKPLGLGKSRLACVLSGRERRALNTRLLRHVLDVVIAAVGAPRTVVVSRDPAVLALARTLGAQPLHERTPADLNRALRQGAERAERGGARAVLVVFGDLPHLTAADVTRMIALAGGAPGVVAAADRARAGTNALLVAPPDAIAFRFGPRSLTRHRREARRHGRRWRVVEAPGLAFDVDRPADWRALSARTRAKPGR